MAVRRIILGLHPLFLQVELYDAALDGNQSLHHLQAVGHLRRVH